MVDDMEYEEREAQLVKEVTEWIAVAERKYKQGFDDGLKQGEDIGRCNTLQMVREAIEKLSWTEYEGTGVSHDINKEALLKELGLKGE